MHKHTITIHRGRDKELKCKKYRLHFKTVFYGRPGGLNAHMHVLDIVTGKIRERRVKLPCKATGREIKQREKG